MSHTTMSGNELRCLHCGCAYELNMPATIKMVAAAARAFDADHVHCKPSAAGQARFEYKTPDQWMRSWDTGVSSKTIWHKMMFGAIPANLGAPPQDPSDFGRCYRLLKAFPEWRARIAEMATVKGWEPFVTTWGELEELFELESPTENCPKLYKVMSVLLGGQR